MWARGIMAMRILFSTTWRPASKSTQGVKISRGGGQKVKVNKDWGWGKDTFKYQAELLLGEEVLLIIF